MFRSILTLLLLYPCAANAQIGRGHLNGVPSGAGPFLSAPEARQSALPLTHYAPSPGGFMQPYGSYGYGTYGGFGYGGFGYGGYGYGNYGYGSGLYGGFSYYPFYSWNQPSVSVYPTTVVVPVTSPMLPPSSRTARLSLEVPLGAEVWLQGKKIDPFAGKRVFESPPLQAGEHHQFDLRVSWMENGNRIEQSEQIDLKAGQHRGVLYMALPLAATQVEP